MTSSTTSWTAITYVTPNSADPGGDAQTGSIEGDIVGNAANPALYTDFDNNNTPGILTDGQIAFRLRLGGDANPTGFNTVAWVGIDANGDGAVDLFVGAINGTSVGIYRAGTGANISPNTTSIDTANPFASTTVSTLNFNFSPVNSTINPGVTNTNLDNQSGGGAEHTDHFVTFGVNFVDLVSAVNTLRNEKPATWASVTNFNENSTLQFIAATSTQANSLNQDLNGITGNINSTSTWTTLGGFTQSFSASGVAVPEPASIWMLGGLGLLALGWRRR